MDINDLQKLSDIEYIILTFELSGKAIILKEDVYKGIDQVSKVLWYTWIGHLNWGDLRVVFQQINTLY